MERTLIIATGVSVVSLLVGGVGGYFFAKHQLEQNFEEKLSAEVLETRKFFSVQKMQRDSGKPDTITEAAAQLPKSTTTVITEVPLVLEGDEPAKVTRYDKHYEPTPEVIEERNVFASGQRPFPVRDPQETPVRSVLELVSEAEYLRNDEDYEQWQLTYYKNDDTLLNEQGETIDQIMVGADNLRTFPEGVEGAYIYIRHNELEVYYEIKGVTDGLSEQMGFISND